MSGGKACGKQAAQYAGKQPDEGSVVTRRDTTAPENEEHSSGRTHRKSMRLKEMSAAKQAGGKGETEKGKQPAAQKKRTRTTRQATTTQPLLLAADAFAAALGAVPAEDWCRTWAAGKTIMLRRTSKRVTEVVDKMRLPAVVRLSRSFWDDARNGTGEATLEYVWRQLAAMTARCLLVCVVKRLQLQQRKCVFFCRVPGLLDAGFAARHSQVCLGRLLVWELVRVLGAGRVEQRSNGRCWAGCLPRAEQQPRSVKEERGDFGGGCL
jgi:hypothetical protein